MQAITLPMPPSLNRYYRTVKGMILISAEGRQYKDTVIRECGEQGIESVGTDRVCMHVLVERADNRRADLDNTLKGLLDAIEGTGVYQNDGQIDVLVVERGPRSATPKVTVSLAPIPAMEARAPQGVLLGWLRRWVGGGMRAAAQVRPCRVVPGLPAWLGERGAYWIGA